MTVGTVSIVIPTAGRPQTLRATLESVLRLDHPHDRLQVVVVDDSGGDPSTEGLVRERQSGSIPIELTVQPRRGAAAARNRGAEVADGELVVFCDDDVIVEEDHLRLHLEKQALRPRVLVNGVSEFAPPVLDQLTSTPFGRYRIALENRFEAEADGAMLSGTCFETRFLTARNLAVRRDLFWELGGFDEAFPHAGAEDQALSIVARDANCSLIRCRDIRVLNNEPIITLRNFCEREERSAQTFVVLVRRFPSEAGRPLYKENQPATRADSAGLIAKKRVKWLLSRRPILNVIHVVVTPLERAKLSERWLQKLYSVLVGLHIFRGVRIAFSDPSVDHVRWN